jgi:3-hydroxy-9,10-secoandrosta-1,3,5(10)-triene-9,17-dione monooxygenase
MDAGVFRAFTPKRYGGLESELLPVFEGLIELGRGCASTSWVAGLLSLHNFLVGLCDPRVQDELWADGPDLLMAASIAPAGSATRGSNGFWVQGRWPFASGVDHCTWAMVTAPVIEENSAPTAYVFFIPKSAYTIQDDWQVSGLCATGSKSIKIKETVFVPKHRARSFRVNTPHASKMGNGSVSWHRHIPWEPLFRLVFAPPAIGNALAMLTAYREHLAIRRAPYTGMLFRDKQASLVRLAHASAEVDAACLMLRRDVIELERHAKLGQQVPPGSIDRMFFDAAYIVDCCTRAVDRLFAGSGGKALYQTNPLQRHFRDMHAMSLHAAADIDTAGELFGKSLLPIEGERIQSN